MDEKELHQKSLQKILDSSGFRDSPTYQKLLRYLFDYHLKGEAPKETTIAMELFQRDASFNPSEDTIVRVYIHELRKRLDLYYKTEGQKEKTRLEIPKGGYELKFDHNSHDPSRWRPQLLVSLLALSIVLNVVFWYTKPAPDNDNLSKITASSIWADILNDDKPILIAIGDVFFFREHNQNTGGVRIIRDENINSIEDLEQFKSQNPGTESEVSAFSRHTYFVEYSAYALLDLLPIVNHANKPVSIRLCTKLNVTDLRTHNIIYIGFLKTLGLFKLYFDKSQFDLTSNYSLSYYDVDRDSLLTFESGRPSRGYHKDYGLIVKFQGLENNKILLLAGTRLPGTMGVVNKVTTLKSIEEIEDRFQQKYQKVPKNFEMLYEVYGLNRQFIQSEMKNLQMTDERIHEIWTLN